MNFSYWEHKHLLADIDYLVVGMGLVGLQAAIRLKEINKSAKVAIVDRFAWSLGASTRNAGFACFANISEIIDDLQRETPDNVYRTVVKRFNGLQKLRSKFGNKEIGYQENGSCEIFTEKNKDALLQGIDSLQSINTVLYKELNLDGVFTYSSNQTLPLAIGQIRNKYEGQLHTGKLYSCVLNYAKQLGVHLFGGLEVTDWNKSTRIHVTTSSGLELSCENLLLCTNAFTSRITSEKVTPARGQVLVTEPLNKLPCIGPHFYDKGYYYWRDIDNRILLGGARNTDYDGEKSFELTLNDVVINELKQFLKNHILGKEVDIAYQWSGIMGMGREKEKSPIVKELESNVFAGVRLGGMGVALSAQVAEDLVKLIQ